MITAVDSSVLLDVFKPDPSFVEQSLAALRRAITEGMLVACDVVWAEIAGAFAAREAFEETMAQAHVVYSPMNASSAVRAGEAWRAYRARGGKRTRVVADFLIGAHARLQADRLLVRHRGFYRTYFPDLAMVDPSGT